MAPTLWNGKICYLEIPAIDVSRSVDFYKAVFGWHIRKRGDGSIAFDDGVSEVSGTRVTGRPASAERTIREGINCLRGKESAVARIESKLSVYVWRLSQ